MELDKRIKENKMPLSCFYTDEAKQYVDAKGYFTNDIKDYKSLDNCYYGTLNGVDNIDGSFLDKDHYRYFNFFLPEEYVKEKKTEKKYRAFKNSEEFFKKTNHKVGNLISIKDKMSNIERHLMIVGYSDNFLYLGSLYYPLSELFDKFEIYERTGKKDEWKPFGVEE